MDCGRIVGSALAATVIPLLVALIVAPILVVNASASPGGTSTAVETTDWRTRIAALTQIQRSLEEYSFVTAENLLRRATAANIVEDEPQPKHALRFSATDAENLAERGALARTPAASTEDAPPPAKFMRVRVGLRPQNSTSVQNSSDFVDKNNTDTNNHGKLVEVKLLSGHRNKNNNSPDKSTDKTADSDHLNNDLDDVSNGSLSNGLDHSHPDSRIDVKATVSEESGDGASARRRLRHVAAGSARFSYSNREHHRHAAGRHHHHHGGQRRRRKGCPPMHGKEQLLCPSRNSHRYDVCVTREQLCDHVADCPNGEDEDPAQCFFYKPVDDQLKTLSHAVLLVVESVMSEQQRRQRQQAEDL